MLNKKKIIFIGSVYFSGKILEKLIKMNIEIVAVICKKKSNYNSDFFDLSKICLKNNLKYKFVHDINSSSSVNFIKKIHPDLILCFGWSQILNRSILSIPSKGVVGYHPSKLPLNRGCHPLIWSLVLGLKNTASTFFWMNSKIDGGQIISQKKIIISKKDNAQSLYDKIIKMSLIQISLFLPKIFIVNNKSVQKRIINNNSIISNYWRKRSFKDGRIDWRMNSENIYNLVRGLSHPYIGAHFIYKKRIIKVWEAIPTKKSYKNLIPGQIIKVYKKNIEIKCGNGSIILSNSKELNKLKQKDYIE